MIYVSITLSGPVAAGTTTAAKALAQKLTLEYHSAGEFFRKYMKAHNIPLPNKEEIPNDVERNLDQKLTDLLASDRPVVVDGLYSGYFARDMNHVLKILLTADENIRIQRALDRGEGETADDVRRRDEAHDLKFRKLYATEDFLDPKFFDLIIDNSNASQEEVTEKIIKKYKEDYEIALLPNPNFIFKALRNCLSLKYPSLTLYFPLLISILSPVDTFLCSCPSTISNTLSPRTISIFTSSSGESMTEGIGNPIGLIGVTSIQSKSGSTIGPPLESE